MKKILIGVLTGFLLLQAVPLKGQALVGKNSTATSYTQASTLQGWNYSNGVWHYYINGKKHTGWLLSRGAWYYLNANGVMTTGWQLVSGKWYFMDTTGAMKTGWLNTGGKWYFLNNDGSMAKGWKSVGGQWYFLEASGAMKTGWLNTGGQWYYLKTNGAMQTGWAKVSNVWYFFHTSGGMKTGWLLDKGEWYYLHSNGSMAIGWTEVNGDYYYLFENGAMAKSTVIDGYVLDESGAWTGEIEGGAEEPFELPASVVEMLEANGYDLEFTDYGWYEYYHGEEWAGNIGENFVSGFFDHLDMAISIAEELTGEDLYSATQIAVEQEMEQVVGDVIIFPYRDIRMVNYVW